MSKPTSELELSTTAREVYKAVERAAVLGATLHGLLALEELREERPRAGGTIDSGLHSLEPRLCELAAQGNAKAIADELARLKHHVQATTVLPVLYKPTPDRPSMFPPPKERPLGGRDMATTYPYLKILGRA